MFPRRLCQESFNQSLKLSGHQRPDHRRLRSRRRWRRPERCRRAFGRASGKGRDSGSHRARYRDRRVSELLQAAPCTSEAAAAIALRCIDLRLPTSGTLNGWRLLQNGSEIRVQVDGSLIFNTIDIILDTALDGLGIAYLPLDQVDRHIGAGRLKRVLDEWTPPLPGYHLCYPSRHHNSPAFKRSSCSSSRCDIVRRNQNRGRSTVFAHERSTTA
ncbi:LysR substrate-binding domain-containing protein [Bradyrhizobium sp. 186]|uniref:LysR substrate-binding domain-containing protein n=1 Tax=Bradyrhizobium sp. 186 TaxID=2782654 RepID=UPI0020007445|nr:LysR substrate-binding domain-containing protein [Bradyrhizobium sp. 186]